MKWYRYQVQACTWYRLKVPFKGSSACSFEGEEPTMASSKFLSRKVPQFHRSFHPGKSREAGLNRSFHPGKSRVSARSGASATQGEAVFILVTGGAKAGKSRFALDLAKDRPFRKRLFVATAVACDSEMKNRIAQHRKDRDGRWATLEEPIHLPERLPARWLTSGNLILIDCLPTFVTNLMLAQIPHAKILRKIQELLKICHRPRLTTIVVTNEVGLGLVPESPLGREFRDLLGTVNQQVARAADEVYFLVAGLPMRVK